MDVGLYTTFDDKKVCDKEIFFFDKLEHVILKESTSVVNPVFILDMRDIVGDMPDISQFKNANYLHWWKMNRWYYCEVIFNGTLVEFHCTLDPRQTWRYTIKGSTQYVERQENQFNRQLFDSEIPLEPKKRVSIYKFPTKVGDSTETSRNYVLITNGKVE